jgi:NADH dehydrogenase FAD-containing subunit
VAVLAAWPRRGRCGRVFDRPAQSAHFPAAALSGGNRDILSPSEVAAPIRQLARKQKNLSVMLAEVTDLDLKSRSVPE